MGKTAEERAMDMHIAQDLPITGIDVYALPPEQGEAVLRRQLAAAYRLVDHFGWTELIYGNKVAPSPHPVNYAGFVIHSAVHMAHEARHKVVMHTHTRAGMAVAAMKEGLQPVSMGSTAFHNRLSYHEYEGPSLDLDERGRLLKNLGDNQALMLRNHGLLVTGRSVPEAFLRLYRLERACQVQLDAAAAGTLNVMGDNLAAKSGADIDRFSEMESAVGIGDLEFAALVRKIDKVDRGWRD